MIAPFFSSISVLATAYRVVPTVLLPAESSLDRHYLYDGWQVPIHVFPWEIHGVQRYALIRQGLRHSQAVSHRHGLICRRMPKERRRIFACHMLWQTDCLSKLRVLNAAAQKSISEGLRIALIVFRHHDRIAQNGGIGSCLPSAKSLLC